MRDHALIAICAIMVLTALTPIGLAQGTSRAQQTPSEDAKAEASSHFRRAVDLFQDGLYRPALVELQRAYEIAPNYRVLFNIGQTHMALGEFVEAIQAYEEFLKQGGSEIDAARRSDLQGQLEHLRRNTARLAILVSQVGATVSVDGKEIGKAPLSGEVALSVGQHRISARAEDGASASEEVNVAGGDFRKLTLTLVAPALAQAPTLEAAPPTQKPPMAVRRKWAIGLLASAGALAIAGGGLALSAKAANDAYQRELDTQPGDPDAIQSAHDQLSRRSVAADVLFGGALAVGITGVVLMFVKGRSQADKASAKRVQIQVGLSPRALVAQGRF
jgi:tetratricopeptide (TPR) repeat protein